MVMNPILEISTPLTATNRSTDLWRVVLSFSESRGSWRTVQKGLVWIQVPGHRYRTHKPYLDYQTLNLNPELMNLQTDLHVHGSRFGMLGLRLAYP